MHRIETLSDIVEIDNMYDKREYLQTGPYDIPIERDIADSYNKIIEEIIIDEDIPHVTKIKKLLLIEKWEQPLDIEKFAKRLGFELYLSNTRMLQNADAILEDHNSYINNSNPLLIEENLNNKIIIDKSFYKNTRKKKIIIATLLDEYIKNGFRYSEEEIFGRRTIRVYGKKIAIHQEENPVKKIKRKKKNNKTVDL